jgi:Icc-related predicted phosphoesterase
MRVLFTSDFHGRLALYEQLTRLLRTEQPEVLVLGGDMHPEATQEDPLGTQAAFVGRELADLINAWRSALPGLAILCILGNHDLSCTQAALQTQQQAGRLVLLDHHQAHSHGGWQWLGLSPAPPSPYWVKDFERRDYAGAPIPTVGGAVWDAAARQLRYVEPGEYFLRQPTLVEELAAAPVVAEPWIFVCHAPPHATRLDHLPNVTEPIGSQAVREFIEARRPVCALHGHVHEAPDVSGCYADRVGETLCINPGQCHDQLQAVVFDTSDIARTLRHTVFG